MQIIKNKISVFCLLFLVFLSLQVFPQEIQSSQPPPVDIEFTAPANPQINQELTITIKIIPYQDVQPEIFCILPFGIEPIPDKDIRIIPYRQMQTLEFARRREGQYYIGLWVGPLKALEAKEFNFRVRIRKKGSYKLTCLFNVLATQSEREKSFTINLN